MAEKSIPESTRNVKRRINADEAVRLWTEEYYSANMIAKEMDFSRTGIVKCLNRHGIDTSKSHRAELKCKHCGASIYLRKADARRNVEKRFCSRECYYGYLKGNSLYNEWRHGTRIARSKMAQIVNLQPEHRVHHIDGNERNNDLANLMVLASATDHGKIHRLINHGVTPIFDGSSMG
jgi:hypothetical protein